MLDSAKQKLLFLWQTEKQLFIASGICLALFILVIISLFLPKQNQIKAPDKSQSLQNTGASALPQAQQALPNPTVSVKNYSLKAPLPSLPNAVTIYTFKTNFSLQEVKRFASLLGLEVTKTDNNFAILSNFAAPQSIGYGDFNLVSGTFNVNLFGSLKPQNYKSGQTQQQEALSILQELKLADSSVSCGQTYQKLGINDITYIKCRRIWQQLGLADYSLLGLLNLPPSLNPADLSLGEVTADTPKDPTIINTNDHSDGFSPQSDFNTITVGIDQNGNIRSIDSSMRQIIAENIVSSSTNVKTPAQALHDLFTQKTSYSLTIPNNSNSKNWNLIYPNNKAAISQATITGFTLSYLELPTAFHQTLLVPTYTFTGVGILNSGSSVRFEQIVPALLDNTSFLASRRGERFATQAVAGAATEANNQLQIGSFTPGPTNPDQPETPIPEQTQTPTPTPPQNLTTNTCSLIPSGGAPTTLNLPGIGIVQVEYRFNAELDEHTFFYVPPPTPGPSINDVRTAFVKAVENQYVKNVAYWYNQSSKPAITDTNSAYAFFSSIYNNQYQNIPYEPPIIPSLQAKIISNINSYDTAQLTNIAEYVASQVVSLYNQGQLAAYASTPDIFPSDTVNKYFHHVLGIYAADLNMPKSCYISGLSPSIFVYSQKTRQSVITLPNATLYTTPQTLNNTWNITTSQDGTLIFADQKINHLYYEFNNSVVFENQQAGFITQHANWQQTISQIATEFGLNQPESTQLIAEVQTALTAKPQSPYLKISLVPQAELDQKLPLRISPKPNHTYRINLALTPLDNSEQIVDPVLPKIDRSGFTVVELGAN